MGEPSNSGAANAGIVRPPLVVLGAMVIGAVLETIWPTALVPPPLAALGVVLVLLAVALFRLSLRQFRAAGTSVRGNVPTTAIVRTGPYRLSRNPIYVSFMLLQLGIALWAGSVWVLAMLLPAAALIACVVVPREERYLASRFGGEYAEYRRSVRRWL
jgi:protein-S-isoprenylcysteine O-methyltransferase Ste14